MSPVVPKPCSMTTAGPCPPTRTWILAPLVSISRDSMPAGNRWMPSRCPLALIAPRPHPRARGAGQGEGVVAGGGGGGGGGGRGGAVTALDLGVGGAAQRGRYAANVQRAPDPSGCGRVVWVEQKGVLNALLRNPSPSSPCRM